ncbi:hypothetical protein B0H19DRAFT_1059187 [Mycena capillaripes]|nr:hypothetical protein B0H19DRAFT_1059187 [Mycena capillaripes]
MSISLFTTTARTYRVRLQRYVVRATRQVQAQFTKRALFQLQEKASGQAQWSPPKKGFGLCILGSKQLLPGPWINGVWPKSDFKREMGPSANSYAPFQTPERGFIYSRSGVAWTTTGMESFGAATGAGGRKIFSFTLVLVLVATATYPPSRSRTYERTHFISQPGWRALTPGDQSALGTHRQTIKAGGRIAEYHLRTSAGIQKKLIKQACLGNSMASGFGHSLYKGSSCSSGIHGRESLHWPGSELPFVFFVGVEPADLPRTQREGKESLSSDTRSRCAGVPLVPYDRGEMWTMSKWKRGGRGRSAQRANYSRRTRRKSQVFREYWRRQTVCGTADKLWMARDSGEYLQL